MPSFFVPPVYRCMHVCLYICKMMLQHVKGVMCSVKSVGLNVCIQLSVALSCL